MTGARCKIIWVIYHQTSSLYLMVALYMKFYAPKFNRILQSKFGNHC